MAFVSAAELFDLDLMKSLLSNGSSVDEQNKFGDTALHICLGRPDFVRFLLSSGASTNVQNNLGSTVLHKAVSLNDKRLISTLIKAKADPNIKNNYNLYPEHYATFIDIFKTLVGDEYKEISIPLQENSGKIIGRKGVTLRKIRMETGAFIDIPKASKDPHAIISGREDAVNAAKKMIYAILHPKKQSELLEEDSSKSARVKLPVHRQHYGKIIGRKGQTLKAIQKEFNVTVIVPKDTSSNIIEIYGEKIDDIHNVVKKINEITQSKDTRSNYNNSSRNDKKTRNQSNSRPIPQTTSNTLPINHR